MAFLKILCALFVLTIGVTGAGAGVDSVREQKKLEARKMLDNGAESPASRARCVSRTPLLRR